VLGLSPAGSYLNICTTLVYNWYMRKQRTNMYLDEEDRHILAFLKERYGLESDASVMRMTLRKVAREEGYVPGQTCEHRQDRPARRVSP
jgi:hypothetical protein